MPPLTPWNVTYVGDCEFELKRQGKWKADVLGCDCISEEWYGRADKLQDFLDSLTFGAPHPTFASTWLADWDNGDGDAGFSSVNLEYTGFRSGKVRPPIYKPSKSIQTISSQATLSDGSKASVEATILAPTGEYTFFMTSLPGANPPTNTDTIKYAGVVNGITNVGSSIVRFKVTKDGGAEKSMSLADFTEALNSLTVSTQLQEWSSEVVVPNALWKCRTVTISTLTPA